ncbi:MAG: hypothetical protein ACE14S_00405 [Candidatus Bathyarchaeia archaeon]
MMAKRTFIYGLTVVGLLLASLVSVSLVCAQEDCQAFRGNSIPDSQIDGVIGSEWDDAGSFTNVAISPWGIAHLWLKQDGTNLYVGLRFVADSENPWVAFQLGPSFCMSTSADGAVFGDDNLSPNGYVDIHFTEGGIVPANDARQDGKGVINVNASKFVIVELKKPLNSGDAEGKDIGWAQGDIGTISIFWDSDGGGSSGGSASHMSANPSSKTVLISADPVPEFPSIILALALMALVLPTAVIARRLQKRTS